MPATKTPKKKAAKRPAQKSAKREIADMLARLPENCTYEDVQYHIYALEKIHNGLRDAEAGNFVSLADVKKRLSKWLTK